VSALSAQIEESDKSIEGFSTRGCYLRGVVYEGLSTSGVVVYEGLSTSGSTSGVVVYEG